MIWIISVILLEIAGCWLLFKYLKREHWRARGRPDYYSQEILRAAAADLTLLRWSREPVLEQWERGTTLKWSRYSGTQIE